MSFEDFIKSKRVAIVGPAMYMMDSKLGKQIDDHDVVVRINRSIESCKEFKGDIGSRTDVLYSCLIEKPENAGDIDVDELVSLGVEFVCVPPRSTITGYANNSLEITEYANLNKLKKIESQIKTRIIDHNLNNDIAASVKCRPNTGYLAIFDLLSMNPKKLSIYGFSFYLDGFMKNVKKGLSEMSEEEYANKCFNSKRHVQSNLWKYAKVTLLNNEKIYLDRTLDKILRMKDFSRESFDLLMRERNA